jgi:hypothetical protein
LFLLVGPFITFKSFTRVTIWKELVIVKVLPKRSFNLLTTGVKEDQKGIERIGVNVLSCINGDLEAERTDAVGGRSMEFADGRRWMEVPEISRPLLVLAEVGIDAASR